MSKQPWQAREKPQIFVGRQGELEIFEQLLSGQTEVRGLHVSGPGGVGKTELLRACARRCGAAGVPVHWLDACLLEPITEHLKDLMGVFHDEATSPEPSTDDRSPFVIVVDGLECWDRIEDWFREVFLPSLPADVLVLLAGRRPLGPRWETDPTWSSRLRAIRLRNFVPSESLEYLDYRGVLKERHKDIHRLTYGHPLACALVCDVAERQSVDDVDLEALPDVVQVLLGRLLRDLPGEAHRTGLEVSALARVTTQDVLRLFMEPAKARAVFDWLRELSVIETTADGLVPHALLRDAVVADLKWRDEPRFWWLLEQLLAYSADHSPVDFSYLARYTTRIRVMERYTEGEFTARVAAERERPVIRAMLREHEGEASVELLDRWWDKPGEVTAVTDRDDQVAAFAVTLPLDRLAPRDIRSDPGVRRLRDVVDEQFGLPPPGGRPMLCVRLWAARDTYQRPSPAQAALFTEMRNWMSARSNLAVFFHCMAEPDSWAEAGRAVGILRLPAADFEMGGRPFGYVYRDFRTRSFSHWVLDLVREAAQGQPIRREPPVTLDRRVFRRAVKRALQHIDRPDLLTDSPLLRTRLVLERCAPPSTPMQRADALAEVIAERCTMFLESPKDRDYYRVLDRTYLRPAVKQRAAADELALSWGTYRRYLSQAVERLTNALWELDRGPLPDRPPPAA